MKTVFIHTVLFWLNDGVSDADKKEFENGMEKLGTVPLIRKYYYGKAAGTRREVVDNSYDYAWIVHFASQADHDSYQDHPIHHEFIEKYGYLWKEVKVFDVVSGE